MSDEISDRAAEAIAEFMLNDARAREHVVEIGDETFKVNGMDDASPDDQRQACMMAFAMCAALGMAVVESWDSWEQKADASTITTSVDQINTVVKIIGEQRFYDFARKSLQQAGIPC